jgi:hypothetical protein
VQTGAGDYDWRMRNVCGPFPNPEIPDRDSAGRMIPPWLKYPNLPRRSMGWRMGVGEQYVNEFNVWWWRLTRDDRRAYQAEYVEPEEWKGFFGAHP